MRCMEMEMEMEMEGTATVPSSYDETWVRTVPQIWTWHVSRQAHAMQHLDFGSIRYL